MTNSITRTEVLNLIESDQQFPVDFDAAWQWAGYTRKDNALRVLKADFAEGEEFSSLKRRASQQGGAAVFYRLTADCFKQFCMMAGTEKGKEVRRYFIECEKQLKQIQSSPVEPPKQIGPTVAEQAMMMVKVYKHLGMEGPRETQHLKDFVWGLTSGEQKALPAVEWLGVTEIAERLGFNPYEASKVCSQLGKAVAAWHRPLHGDPKKEQRLFNGRMTPMNVYQSSKELDAMVYNFLLVKGLMTG